MFVLWVFIIHVACYIYHRLRGGKSSVLRLGLNCLLLTTNNTGCIGWPVLIATVGQQSAVLSMLLGEGLSWLHGQGGTSSRAATQQCSLGLVTPGQCGNTCASGVSSIQPAG